MTICQSYCSPVSFKKCIKKLNNQYIEYCCLCEFWKAEYKNTCIPVIPNEIG